MLASGEKRAKPTGDACEACFRAWNTSLKYEYGSWRDLCDRVASCQDTRSKVAGALSVLSGESQAEFAPESVTSSAGVSMEIKRHFVMLSEAELRAELRVPRLLKSHTRGVPSVTVHSETNPGEKEVVFAFADPDRPHRTGTITTRFGVASQSTPGPPQDCGYAGQGLHQVREVYGSQHDDASKLVSARLVPLCEFLESQGAGDGVKRSPASKRQASQAFGDDLHMEEDEDEPAQPPQATLVGIGAKHIQAAAEAGFVSPGKPRPRVPAFASSSGASVSSCAASAACVGHRMRCKRPALSAEGVSVASAGGGGDPPSDAPSDSDGDGDDDPESSNEVGVDDEGRLGCT